MDMLGIDNVPSLTRLKDIDRMLQSFCGVRTIRYEGNLGHVYYGNNLGDIIAQVCPVNKMHGLTLL